MGVAINESYNWILKAKNWEINNYERFLEIVEKTPDKHKPFLTQHGMDEITKNDWITYTLKGHDVAFALHYIEPGKIDICNFVNNSDLRGVSNIVLQFAKSQGGTQMDNYRGIPSEQDPEGNGYLGNLYRNNGFNRQTWRDKFNPELQPSDPKQRFIVKQNWFAKKFHSLLVDTLPVTEYKIFNIFLFDYNTEEYGTPDVEGLELSKHRAKYNNTDRQQYKDKFDKRIGSKFK